MSAPQLFDDGPTVGDRCAACGRPGRYPADHCPRCVAAGVVALRLDLGGSGESRGGES